MTTATAPGYARPNTAEYEEFDYFDIGRRVGSGTGSYVQWRPIGTYQEAGVGYTWGLDPGKFAFTLAPDHPLTSVIQNVDRTVYHFRAGVRGRPFSGRIMQKKVSGAPWREKFLYTGVCNKIWVQRFLAWVNPLFPPEIQVGLTGKQDIMWGPPDPVFKYYLAKNMARLHRPVYAALPLKWPSEWSAESQPNLDDIDTLDDMLGLIADATDPLCALAARFTYGDELFKQTVDRLEYGVSVDFWDGVGTSPEIFSTQTLSDLQSIIDYSDDHFLDLSQLLKPINNGLFSFEADRACYVFDTHEKRDRRQVQFRTDAEGQIDSYDMTDSHADATRVAVGGKSPQVVNDIIEIGANLAIQLLINAVAPGLGLGVTVGDLFDDILFAYQVFWDDDLENDLGEDDALAEVFGDNTAAWSLDSFAIGHTKLKEHGGEKNLIINATSGGPDGRGNSFGADNGTARRYRCGDTVTFWDRGNTVEQYVSAVNITSKPGERMREQVVVGPSKQARGPWERMFGGISRVDGALNGIANSF